MKIKISPIALALIPTLWTSLDAQAAGRCADVFANRGEQVWKAIQKEIRPEEPTLDYKSNLSYLRELKRNESNGLMRSEYSERFETRFYYAATATPGRDGKVQWVDPKSKAVYVFVHGSGTMKSSGRNFFGLMNTLGQSGYSSMSFDLPFHMEGPRRPSFENSKEFMKWFDGIMAEVRKQAGDKPIYLAGHSFGPDVIAEYLYQNPNAVQGALLASPAGFNPVLSKWYEQYTSKMKFGGDTAENTAAGLWAGAVTKGFLWNKTNGQNDPTIANPDLKVRVLSGNREEYVPAPLGPKGLPAGKNTYDLGEAIREHLRDVTVTIEDGVGHYLFEHKDSKGRNAFLRELLALDGVDSLRLNELIRDYADKTQKSTLEQVQHSFATDRIFATWVRSTYGERAFRTAAERGDENFFTALSKSYALEKETRYQQILEEVLKFADTNPEFAEKYTKTLTQIRNSKSKGINSTLFLSYLDYLENQPR